MKRLLLLAMLLTMGAWPVSTQTRDDLLNDEKTPGDVLLHSMGYARQSYSPLTQIDTSNVKRLVPVWSTSLMNDLGELAAPAVHNGVMYVINGTAC
jgi:alcohol dehydrogenase (cytochrome c)